MCSCELEQQAATAALSSNSSVEQQQQLWAATTALGSNNSFGQQLEQQQLHIFLCSFEQQEQHATYNFFDTSCNRLLLYLSDECLVTDTTYTFSIPLL